MRRTNSSASSVGLGLALLSVGSAFAATLRVPAEYATINAAVDVAVSGDSVLVAPGMYEVPETRVISFGGSPFTATCMVFLKDGVAVLSEAGPEMTVLDPSGSPRVGEGWVIVGALMPSTATVFEGFTVTGSVYGYSGLWVEDSGKLTIRNCHFRDLDAGDFSGGGFTAASTEVHVVSCRFTNCRGASGSAIRTSLEDLVMEDCVVEGCSGQTGAVDIFGSSFVPGHSFRIERCVFRNNVGTLGSAAVQKSGDGGLGRNVIRDCLFEGNQGSGTGAVFAGGFEFRLEENLFVGNSVGPEGVGGAVGLIGFSMVVSNNTFVDNYQGQQGAGSALYVVGPSSLYLTRNVFRGNGPVPAVGMFSSPFILENGCNVYWENPGGNTFGTPMGATDREADPLFCDAENGDYTVSAESPCASDNSLGCGQIGALGVGCGVVGVEPTSWARMKALYR